MDILIFRMVFPNDPYKRCLPHQVFVAVKTNDYLDVFSISSIPGKENRVYGQEADRYEVIIGTDQIINGFRMPSFIDCSKRYRIALSAGISLSALSARSITEELKDRVLNRIQLMENEGHMITYSISSADFKHWNPAIQESGQA